MRELNKQIFQDGGEAKVVPQSSQRTSQAKEYSIDSTDLQIIAVQIEQLKKRVKELDERASKTSSRLEELAQASRLKFDKVNSTFLRIEDVVKRKILELTEKIGTFSAKVTAAKFSEHKINELVDRHNQMIQAFETRMIKMQRVINEQELQLHNSKAALNEARREIEKLKKL